MTSQNDREEANERDGALYEIASRTQHIRDRVDAMSAPLDDCYRVLLDILDAQNHDEGGK